jgi:hypothetical protein
MRIAAGLAVLALLWAAPGCKPKREAPPAVSQEAKRTPTVVTMGDPKAAAQLVSGFYDIEDGAWRWTGKQFAIELGTPLDAGGRGATLELKFNIPPAVIQKNQSVTLTGSVDGNLLPPETYARPGEAVYRREVAAALLARDTVKVGFEVDKPFQPAGGDERVLGVIATSVGLTRK